MGKLTRRVVRGATAGTAGTLAMDLLWWSRHRRAGGEDGFFAWEFAGDVRSFEEASAPGKVGQRAASLVGVELPGHRAATTTNLVHWLTGAGYGVAHALVHAGRGRATQRGAATGLAAVATSYAAMGTLGFYEPVWRYDAATLAKDVSAHLLFGVTVGVTHAILTPARES